MSDLVQRLCTGDHPVEVGPRPERTAEAFRKAIDRGYVHIRFTDTRGGTELGVALDRTRSAWNEADFTRNAGRIQVVGDLTLDSVRVRCIAEINLPELDGRGRLELA